MQGFLGTPEGTSSKHITQSKQNTVAFANDCFICFSSPHKAKGFAGAPVRALPTYKNNPENTDVFSGLLVRRKGPRIASQSAWLDHPRLRLRYRPAPLFAKNSPPDCFLYAQTLSGFESHHMNNAGYPVGYSALLVRRKGLEPPTYWFVVTVSKLK